METTRDGPRRGRVMRSDPTVQGGAPVFAGTAVPVRALLDHLDAGRPLEAFLADFPQVKREQAEGALEQVGTVLLARWMLES